MATITYQKPTNKNTLAGVGKSWGTAAKNILSPGVTAVGPGPRISDYATGQSIAGTGGAAPSGTGATPPNPTQPIPTYEALYNEFKSAHPAPTPFSYTPQAQNIQTQIAGMAPTPITPKSQSYYDQQKEAIKNKIRQEFFGPLGTAQQVASSESAAGRLGSGVGQRVLEEAVTRPFTQEMGNIELGVNQQQADEAAALAQLNAQRLDAFNQQAINARLAAEQADTQGGLAASEFNQRALDSYNNLLMGLVNGEVNLSQQDKESMYQEFMMQLEKDKMGMELANQPVNWLNRMDELAGMSDEELRALQNSYPGQQKFFGQFIGDNPWEHGVNNNTQGTSSSGGIPTTAAEARAAGWSYRNGQWISPDGTMRKSF